MTDPALQAFLEQQRAGYRASLPQRLADLDAGLARLGAGQAGALQDLERCAHGLAGSAATFGLPALGDAARALEDAIEAQGAAPLALAAALRQQLLQAIEGAPR